MHDITISPYLPEHKESLIGLVLDIQQREFGIAITRADQPDMENIPGVYQQRGGNFWVAEREGQGEVIGTIALIDIGNGLGVLRKMFVKSFYRGAPYKTASRLLHTLVDYAKTKEINTLYLGTIDRYHAAHRFYEKNGFRRITKEELPPTFPLMQVDNMFYTRTL